MQRLRGADVVDRLRRNGHDGECIRRECPAQPHADGLSESRAGAGSRSFAGMRMCCGVRDDFGVSWDRQGYLRWSTRRVYSKVT